MSDAIDLPRMVVVVSLMCLARDYSIRIGEFPLSENTPGLQTARVAAPQGQIG
jgi:hypothetical protein